MARSGSVIVVRIASVLSQVWDRAIGVQPAPSVPVVAGTGLVALLLITTPSAWRYTRNLVTIAHEAAHGVAALASGRRLSGIRLHSDTSGLTLSRGRSSGPGMIVTAAAGYAGPGLLGLGAAYMLRIGHAVGLLWLALVLLTLLLVQIRNFFGLCLGPAPPRSRRQPRAWSEPGAVNDSPAGSVPVISMPRLYVGLLRMCIYAA